MGRQPEFHPHPNEEMLEEYVFRRLTEAETAALEEHILVCEACQKNLGDIDEYILLMKAATAAYDVHPPPVLHTVASRVWERVHQAVGAPGFGRKTIGAFALALALLLTISGLTKGFSRWRAEQALPPAVVVLTALRGGDDAGVFAQGPAGRRLDLSIDAADLPPAQDYRIEVVNTVGRGAWSGAATASGASLSVHVATGFRAGTYWVRLFTPQGQLLREFGLRLQ